MACVDACPLLAGLAPNQALVGLTGVLAGRASSSASCFCRMVSMRIGVNWLGFGLGSV